MCLRLENELVRREIADTDMTVYKYMYERTRKCKLVYHTPYMGYEMQLNKLNKSILHKDYVNIEQGLHSLQDLDSCVAEAKSNLNPSVNGNTVIVRCTIPKGAHFYRGTYGKFVSFASSRIILNEIVKTI